uniref:EF-hand domain-containing protein n=1 Tax=Noctiluca scintillans TaxID=2966 RepID=A0A7S1B0R9_NOCSC|mmetsp:Transcript_822/g.2350  ORF Transcript_822/g.2350 Transcript_822/m.2350 type:complete len:275 (+) Transcript_822:49-873(+)|eukprot:CAMPEP_0194490360 /NCGR_PEP_ID=MMETSP0253-20130528/9602_1 /TAXON_ID=2966 /ORGANISM="Noctiluca scintillans" /LENGTH=274 /DNA_ID=CAMNT_0039330979 /DNA_START=49 /DNA_END=873 /DNA_ORIENTATION=-
MAEPAAKRQKPGSYAERFAEARDTVLKDLTREKMLDDLFETWDRDGSGGIDFEEILPHYIKSDSHRDETEADVRQGYEAFCKANDCDTSKGLSKELFRSWLKPMTDVGVASRYVTAVLGMTKEPYHMNVNFAVVKEYESKTLQELCEAPPHAIQGISELSDEVMSVLGLKTVRDMGTWRFYRHSRAIVALAEKEEAHAGNGKMNIRNGLDREHETKSLKDIQNLHVSALAGFPAKCDDLLAKLRINTIQQLGKRKVFAWAAAIVDLAELQQAVS